MPPELNVRMHIRASATCALLLLTSCGQSPGPMQVAALGLLQCRNTFNSTFIAMAKTFASIPAERRFELLLGVVKERETCDERAVKSAVSQ